MNIKIFFQMHAEVSITGLIVELQARFWWRKNRDLVNDRLRVVFENEKYSDLFKGRETVMVWLCIDEHAPTYGAEFAKNSNRCTACQISLDRISFYKKTAKMQLDAIVDECANELDRFLKYGHKRVRNKNCSGVWEISFAMKNKSEFELRRRVEDFLSDLLQKHSLGVIEGTQIGSGSFEIFVEISSDATTRELKKLIRSALISEGIARPIRIERTDSA